MKLQPLILSVNRSSSKRVRDGLCQMVILRDDSDSEEWFETNKSTDSEMTDNTRIVIDPQICHGEPCVRGLRYPLTMILELLASGMSHAEILADYADLEEEDLRACLNYAARISDVKTLSRITS